jgi:hypothetical protein
VKKEEGAMTAATNITTTHPLLMSWLFLNELALIAAIWRCPRATPVVSGGWGGY